MPVRVCGTGGAVGAGKESIVHATLPVERTRANLHAHLLEMHKCPLKK